MGNLGKHIKIKYILAPGKHPVTMKTLNEFQKLTKPKMVVCLIEIMVQQGWCISNFVYGFRAYTKLELISQYQEKLKYAERNK